MDFMLGGAAATFAGFFTNPFDVSKKWHEFHVIRGICDSFLKKFQGRILIFFD